MCDARYSVFVGGRQDIEREQSDFAGSTPGPGKRVKGPGVRGPVLVSQLHGHLLAQPLRSFASKTISIHFAGKHLHTRLHSRPIAAGMRRWKRRHSWCRLYGRFHYRVQIQIANRSYGEFPPSLSAQPADSPKLVGFQCHLDTGLPNPLGQFIDNHRRHCLVLPLPKSSPVRHARMCETEPPRMPVLSISTSNKFRYSKSCHADRL